MRVDPLYTTTLINSLDQTTATEQQLSQEISSGSSVNSLSDNPLAAGQNVSFTAQLNLDDTFSQTASSTEGMLQVTDSALGSVVTQLNSAISVATQANNGTLSASDLQSAATQLSGIRDEVLSLANTSYLGTYVFSGSQGNTQPFTLDNSSSPATVTYNGDSDVNYLETPNGQKIQLNLPGDQVFNATGSSVLGALNDLIADYSSGTQSSAGANDISQLNTALGYLSQQRVTIDNSLSRLSSAQTYSQTEATQLTTAQTNLMQANIPQVATELSSTETQQAALMQVIPTLEKNSLFNSL